MFVSQWDQPGERWLAIELRNLPASASPAEIGRTCHHTQLFNVSSGDWTQIFTLLANWANFLVLVLGYICRFVFMSLILRHPRNTGHTLVMAVPSLWPSISTQPVTCWDVTLGPIGRWLPCYFQMPPGTGVFCREWELVGTWPWL